MKKISFKASDLITGHSVVPLVGVPTWFNLEFKAKTKAAEKVGGCGLYCVSYKGQAIYVGKFLGTESDPFGGNLQKIRWERHIPSLSMRGQRVSMGKSVLARLIQENTTHALTRDLALADQVRLTKYRGYHASYNRMQFASRHWDELMAEPDIFLPNFEFGYVQFERSDLEDLSNTAIWKLVSNAEDLARQQLHLCCNGESNFRVSITDQPFSTFEVLEHLQTHMVSLRDQQRGHLGTIRVASQSNTHEHVRSNRTDLPNYQQAEAAMERLEESLPSGWRTEWLERLRIAVQGADLEIHATGTGNHGDVRVRALDLKRKRNLFTMAWRPSDGRFSCRIMLDEQQVVACPGVEMKASSASNPLKTGFIFDASKCQDDAFKGLLHLIAQAHRHAKAAGL